MPMSSTGPNLVFFDLETTGLRPPVSILQLSAINFAGDRTFDAFAAPGPGPVMELNAREITGMEIDEEGNLTRHGREVRVI